MRNHLRPAAPRIARAAVAALLLAALASPTAGRAAQRAFASGSLIIPSSIEYQTDTGVLATYGIIYVALWKNETAAKPITVYWAVQPRKLSQYRCDTTTAPTSTDPTSAQFLTGRNAPPLWGPSFNDNDGCDLAVSAAVTRSGVNFVGGQPVSLLAPNNALQNSFSISNITYTSSAGPSRAATTHLIDSSTPTVKYLGGAWIIDATDRQAFLNLLQNEAAMSPFHKDGTGSSLYVKIHSANQNFTAPVASVLTSKPPRTAVIGSNQVTFLTNVLVNSGVCGPSTIPAATCGGTFGSPTFTSGTSGVVYDYYPNAADLLNNAAGYPDGRLNRPVNGETYGLMWAGDGATPDNVGVGNIGKFLDTAGNNLFAEYDSPNAIEALANRFQSTTGINDVNPNIPSFEDCNDQYLANGSKFKGNGGSCMQYCDATNSTCTGEPYAQTGNFNFDGGQGSYKGYTPLVAFKPGVKQVLQVGGGGPTIASAVHKDNDPSKGLILYLAGHRFDNGRFWGERVILNTLFSRLNPLTGTELSRSEPSGYRNNVPSTPTQRVYQGTYVQLPLPDSGDVTAFNASAAQVWQFPYTTGHLYEYDLAGIATTAQTFNSNINWDAALKMPSPSSRRIFTAVGASPNTLGLPLGSGPLGWKMINFRAARNGGSDAASRPLNEIGTACTDADGDGRCDLSQLLAACNTAGVTTGLLQARTVNGTQAQKLGLFVSQARGHCSAHTPVITGTPILESTDAECDCSSAPSQCSTPVQNNRARLGGIDHSNLAIVGPSPFISAAPWKTRPVVTYAAGQDGMLHAFFVSGYDGSSTSSWDSTEGVVMPAGAVPGQELWAFIPPGQVCGLATNNGVVDGNINVVDVFGDFPYDRNNDGSIDWTTGSTERPNHQRRWRTLLTATAGPGGSEMFALDVTNPLKPVLLWHIGGPTEQDGRTDSNGNGVFDVGEVFNPSNVPTNDPARFAIKWYDWDDGNSTTDYIPSNFNTTSATVLDELKTGRFDYRNLGESYATAVGKMWSGTSYQYLLFVATNAADFTTQPGASTNTSPAGLRGSEVFAVDLVTGQKVWQWEHFYSQLDGTGVDNSIPPRMALGDLDSNGSLDRIYVGDLEGRLWELSASDGRNLNYLPDTNDVYHSFPLFGTDRMTGNGPPAADASTIDLFKVNGTTPLSRQPLTTPIGLGRFTSVPPAFTSYIPNRLSLVVGTMGVDWAISPFEPGNIFVIPVSPSFNTRLTDAAAKIDVTVTPSPLEIGILKPVAAWKIPLDVGERVYSTPVVVNNTVIVNTAFGSFSGDISGSTTDSGNLRIITGDLVGSGTHTSTTANNSKAFGGVLVMGGKVVTATDTKIKQLATVPAAVANAPTGQAGLGTALYQHLTPVAIHSWEVVQ